MCQEEGLLSGTEPGQSSSRRTKRATATAAWASNHKEKRESPQIFSPNCVTSPFAFLCWVGLWLEGSVFVGVEQLRSLRDSGVQVSASLGTKAQSASASKPPSQPSPPPPNTHIPHPSLYTHALKATLPATLALH